MNTFEKARRFIYRNARPLELARWQYHFENGSREAVLKALAFYQNQDGGFGHAVEADSFNPNSCPIQTWQAIAILKDVGLEDASHPIIEGILRYLDSGADFSEERGQWLNTVSSNDNYPHAIWWSYSDKETDFRYNPTACLAGFILRFAPKDGGLYKKAEAIAQRAFDWFKENAPVGEKHIAGCFISLFEYMSEAGLNTVDMDEFKSRLIEEVNANICRSADKWLSEYVCRPSAFIRSRDSIFYKGNEEPAAKECEVIISSQLDDGSFAVPWQWFNDYREFTLAENWWKSVIVIENMMFLKGFEAI
ncbi:MAG: hypothetical protein NC203_05005 [Firmicutes bacterium]|nr:hypothetical protein [[Eubacterium] siraeum]MCM1487709.1 hypothetical protein [Bacillota bacterium]